MLEAIRRAMTFLRQKQVLHKLGVVISVAVIVALVVILNEESPHWGSSQRVPLAVQPFVRIWLKTVARG